MTWNYRVIRKETNTGEHEFGIHEVYYDEKGNIENWSEDSMVPNCPSEEGLEYEIKERILKALEKDTLDLRELDNS